MKALLAGRLLNILTALQSFQNGSIETDRYIKEPKIMMVTIQNLLLISISINIYKYIVARCKGYHANCNTRWSPRTQITGERWGWLRWVEWLHPILLDEVKKQQLIIFSKFLLRPRLRPIIFKWKRFPKDSFEMHNIDKIRMWKRSGMPLASFVEDSKFSGHLRKLVMSFKLNK